MNALGAQAEDELKTFLFIAIFSIRLSYYLGIAIMIIFFLYQCAYHSQLMGILQKYLSGEPCTCSPKYSIKLSLDTIGIIFEIL